MKINGNQFQQLHINIINPKNDDNNSKNSERENVETDASTILSSYGKSQIHYAPYKKDNTDGFYNLPVSDKKKFIKRIMETDKNSDGSKRFNDEKIYTFICCLIQKNNVDYIYDLIEKKDDGNYRYTPKEIADIIPFLTGKEAERTLHLLNLVDEKKCKKDTILDIIRNPDIKHIDDEQISKFEKFMEYKISSSEAFELAQKLVEEKHLQRGVELLEKKTAPNYVSQISLLDDDKYSECIDFIDNKKILAPYALQIINLDEANRAKFDELCEMGIDTFFALCVIENNSDAEFMRLKNLVAKGIDTTKLQSIISFEEERYRRFINLMDNGFDFTDATEISFDEHEYEKEMKEINLTPNEMRDFLNSKDYNEKISKAAQGKFPKELSSLLNNQNMNYTARKDLLQSSMSEEDFINSIKKISKSTFKLAMSTPNQYLSGIDVKYTKLNNGKYVKLSDDVLCEQRKQICKFFGKNIGKIARALKYIDTDTINQMMDKRTNIFEEMLSRIDLLSNENYELLSDLIKCKSALTGKDLTARDKIQLCQIVEIYQEANIDNSILHNMAKNGTINIFEAKKVIQNAIFEKAGIDKKNIENIPESKKKLNEEYSYLALKGSDDIFEGVAGERLKKQLRNEIKRFRRMSPNELEHSLQVEILKFLDDISDDEIIKFKEKLTDIYRHLDEHTDEEIMEVNMELYKIANNISVNDEIYTVIRNSISGDFGKYITDESNIYGQTNAKTKKDFEDYGLNYEKWLNPEADEVDVNLKDKHLKVKFWNRNPLEDLFLGNKTTCCTAIGTGTNSASTPLYLLNTAFNVVELCDEQDNVVGMSRVFAGKIDNKPAVFMDNFELNNTFIKNMSNEDLKKIRNGFFKYINQYAKEVIGDERSQVYFFNDCHFGINDDLKRVNSVTDFIGEISSEKIYINSANLKWINPKEMSELGKIPWFVVPENIE